MLRSSREGTAVTPSLSRLNALFLREHQIARAVECEHLRDESLVVRYAFGHFEARLNGVEIISGNVNPALYHPLKDVTHAVLLTALLTRAPSGADRTRRCEAAMAAIDAVLGDLADRTSQTYRSLAEADIARQQRLLERARLILNHLREGALSPEETRVFFVGAREDVNLNLRQLSRAITRELDRQMRAVHDIVNQRSPAAWDSMLVVVGVMHQARAREVGIQYFERLLHEPVGEGARNERRLVVAENSPLAADQRGLLAAHVVDREAAKLIFDDANRLQWDVLGDTGGTLDELFSSHN